MPSINRTTIITGPARITFGGQTFWSKGDITLTPTNTRFDVETSAFGRVDSRFSSKTIEVSFEPDGRFTAALAGVLWPYAATSIGASIYGATDRALVINGRDGVQVTVHNAALTEMPSIRLGVAQTIQGDCKFVGLLANSKDPTAADAYYTIASVAYPGDTGWAVSDIKTLAYSSAWGATAPWNSFLTEEGWEIGFDLSLSEQIVDGLGVVDMTLQNLQVTAQCIPVGPTMANVLEKMGHTQALGSSIAAQGADLKVNATGIFVEVRGASIVETDMGWGPERKRVGQTTWEATRSVTAGSPNALFYVGTTAPT